MLETSLVVQWLRICSSNAGDPGSIPGQRTKSCMPQLRPGTVKNILKIKHGILNLLCLVFHLCHILIASLESMQRLCSLVLPPERFSRAIPVCVCVYVCVLGPQSCSTVCDPFDHSPPGSSVHGIFQARILEWVAIPFSRRSSLLY